MQDAKNNVESKYLINSICVAHVKHNECNEWVIHTLEDHLRAVGIMAGKMAAAFNAEDWARTAGFWHDLGKYRSIFQQYIKSTSGYESEAHIEQGKGRVDHSTTGAIHAINELGCRGRILAYLIAGHHAGLPDWSTLEGGNSALEQRLEKGRTANHLKEALENLIPSDILKPKLPTAKPCGSAENLHLWIRMLFSCLVDADFLDTEFFMAPERQVHRGSYSSLDTLKLYFDRYMQNKTAEAQNTSINKMRQTVLSACREAAALTPGIFTLTVPTGGGKTLASMAFALEHAIKHNKTRIIVAIPYTSIIEQTAEQYREIFGDEVIEHHSNLDPSLEKENSKNRLASENWDAPLIVTTNVQLLESLFAARPSRCRKLHNIVNSVVIIDEAQLLPPAFLQPTVSALRLLTLYYGVTLVLTTATQPYLSSCKNAFGKTTFLGFDNTQEIIPNLAVLYSAFSRVTVEKPCDLALRSSWEDIVQELCKIETVLVIVNTRQDCRVLFDLMPEGTFHLSGLMCGEHRSQVIKEIKHKLNSNEPVRVVSTQLVEAGVDLDFPVVYRALAGLDSLAQAAGRCNREGKLEKGRFVIFVPPQPSPRGMLRAAEDATKLVWNDWHGEALDYQLYDEYFKQYFGKLDKDRNSITALLTNDASEGVIQFRTAASRFQIIEEKSTVRLLVPYLEKGQYLLDLLKANGPERYLMRELQRYSVTVYLKEIEELKKTSIVEEIVLGVYAVTLATVYDKKRGLLVAEDLYSMDASATVF